MLEQKKPRREIAKEAYFSVVTPKESHDDDVYDAAWERVANAVVCDFSINDLLILLKQKAQYEKGVYTGLGREWAVFVTEVEKLQAWHYCWLDERGEKP